MDMERIKQNLRLRSGRSKNQLRNAPTIAAQAANSPPPVNPNKELPHRPISQPTQQRTVSAQPVDDSPSLRNWDREIVLPRKTTSASQRPQTARRASPAPAAAPKQRERPNGLNSHPPDERPKSAPKRKEPAVAEGRPRTANRDEPTQPRQTPTATKADDPSPPAAKPKPAKRAESTRYGKSGIERTPSRPLAPAPAPAPETSKPPPAAANPAPEPKVSKSKPSQNFTLGAIISSSSEDNFDLQAPPSKPRPTSMDKLCELLFSAEHLNVLLHDPALMSRFSVFLRRYKPQLSEVVLQYLEYQKAIKAIEYANAVAESIKSVEAIIENAGRGQARKKREAAAAELSKGFAETSRKAYDLLVHEALPAYITYILVKLSTECLTAEITSHSTMSLTSNLIGGLSEVFCLSDPTQPDNPLIYCSEEFYRLTGYTSGDVLGRNCRFLQGPKTDKIAVQRIRDAIDREEGCNETILNYRRDGRGFVNVLMIAPLEDDKGQVKYFLGAQVDVSRLVAGGWGLDGLEKLVQKRELEEMRGRTVVKGKKDQALKKLRELSEMFDMEESAIVRSHSRSSSLDRSEIASGATSVGGSTAARQSRRVFGDNGEESGSEDGSDAEEKTKEAKNAWNLATSGSSGKLPGLYQNYLLIRPAPSLRIIFASPALRRRRNIGQKPFLSHIAAPIATLSGLKESFTAGTPVTAKVAFMPEPGKSRDGQVTGRWRRPNSKNKSGSIDEEAEKDPSTFGRTCWISATPLMGADEEVGVWIVVLVDRSKAPGKILNQTKGEGMAHQQLEGRILGLANAVERNEQIQLLSDDIRNDDIPIKPVRVGGTSRLDTPIPAESPSPPEDRKRAREMYDNDGREAVKREAIEEPERPLEDEAPVDEPDDAHHEATKEYSSGEESTPVKNTPKEEEKMSDKADSADDEDSGPGPADEEDEEHYIVHSPNLEHEENGLPKEQDNAQTAAEGRNFVDHEPLPLTPEVNERVVIRSASSSDADDPFSINHKRDEEHTTPTRTRHRHSSDDEDEGEWDETSRPGVPNNARASLYVDYWGHPGKKELKKPRKKDGDATPSDPDCEVYSPYSVD